MVAKPKWSAAEIPDLTGRVAIVTGASSGVGYEIARALATHGARVIAASRDPDSATRSETAPRVEPQSLDLGSLASIRGFVERFAERHRGLDVLVNNAGISGGPRRLTADGLEAHFQVNYLGHFALTGLLLPLLSARTGARVVTMSSDVASKGVIDFDDLQTARRYGLVRAYAQSKLANLLFAFELDRRARAAGLDLASFAAHPGVAKSNLFVHKRRDWGRSRNVGETLLRLVQMLLAQPAAMGALPALYQATSPAADSARYVGPSGFPHGRGFPGSCAIPARARDRATASRLWDVSMQLSGISYLDER